MIKQYDQLVKLILIGGSGVGKSSLLMQFAENKFTQNYLTTIGVDFKFKTIKQDGRTVKFQIWDTAGQQRFRTITSVYYKGADGIIMVYDITEPSSIDDLQSFWINEAYNYCDKSIKVLLLGNKSDCDRVVNPERIRKMAQKNGYITQEVSAKTGDKVYDCIKNFGMSIARAKMQKSGFNWYVNSATSATISSNTNSSTQPQVTQQINMNPVNQVFARSQTKQAPKAVSKAQQTIKISSNKKGSVPNYQKKCC